MPDVRPETCHLSLWSSGGDLCLVYPDHRSISTSRWPSLWKKKWTEVEKWSVVTVKYGRYTLCINSWPTLLLAQFFSRNWPQQHSITAGEEIWKETWSYCWSCRERTGIVTHDKDIDPKIIKRHNSFTLLDLVSNWSVRDRNIGILSTQTLSYFHWKIRCLQSWNKKMTSQLLSLLLCLFRLCPLDSSLPTRCSFDKRAVWTSCRRRA